eukprot:c5150_g1_i1.p1 GENE.c5150_g1_i1~~c5150_g1_i1.p1  ORF type:complete len:371 (-),score=97.83 c5150_g1_i1:72-1184(-)
MGVLVRILPSLLLFLLMEPVWSASPVGMQQAVTSSPSSLSSLSSLSNPNTLSESLRKWSSVFMNQAKEAVVAPQIEEKGVQETAAPPIIDLSEFLTVENRDDLITWFNFTWPSAANTTIDEEDMTALQIVFISSLVMTIITAVMVLRGYHPCQTITIGVFGLTAVFMIEMYVIAAMKGDIDSSAFNISRVVARSPGSIFGIAIALVWLLLPLMELLREHHSRVLRLVRFGIAITISLLIALITFEPELNHHSPVFQRLPHYVVVMFLIAAILVQTGLIFTAVNTTMFLKVLPMLVLVFETVGVPVILVKLANIHFGSPNFLRWLGIWQLGFLSTVLFMWTGAAFANRKPVPAVLTTTQTVAVTSTTKKID